MSYFDLLTSVSPKTTHIFLSTKQFCDREDPRKLLGPVIFNCGGGGRVFGPPRTRLSDFALVISSSSSSSSLFSMTPTCGKAKVLS